MGSYYLCETARARYPYYVESIGIYIWSIEELCFYMKENIYLLDETILNERLAKWIQKELGLKKLGSEIRRALEEKRTAADIVMPIFERCGYLTETELILFQEELQQIQIEPRDVRKKMKADYLVNYGMYVRAIEEYQNILRQRVPGRLQVQFYATVLENMATAYARLFRFEEAANCLWESYNTLKSRKVYEKYLRILPLFMSETRYRERLAGIRADLDHAAAMKADLAAIWEEAQTSEFAVQWDTHPINEQIEEMKWEYVKNTKN